MDVFATGADADGGTAIVWSDARTDMQGAIRATGAGSGGFVELSSAGSLLTPAIDSLDIGPGGKLLLDPTDINVSGAYQQSLADLLLTQGTDVSLLASNNITWSGDVGGSETPFSNTRYGTLTLQAGNSISISGAFDLVQPLQTGTTDGSVVLLGNDAIAAATGTRDPGTSAITTTGASFDLGRGTFAASMGADAGANLAGEIGLPRINAASVTVDNAGSATNGTISFHDLVGTQGDQTYTGSLVFFPSGAGGTVLNSSAGNVSWTNEATAHIRGGSSTPVAVAFQGVTGRSRYGILSNVVGGTPLIDATRLSIGVGAGTHTRVYGDDPDAVWVARGSLFGSDTLASLAPGSLLALTGDLSPGNLGRYTPVGVSSVSAQLQSPGVFALNTANGGYFVDLSPTASIVTTTPKPLDYRGISTGYAYGQPTQVANLMGILPNDSVGMSAYINGQSTLTALVWNSDFEAFTFPVNLPVGGHSAQIAALTGTSAGNYMLGNPVGDTPYAYISPALLTVTPMWNSKIYGDNPIYYGTPTTYGFTVSSGLVAGDSLSSITLNSAGAAGTAPVGQYSVVASAAQGSGLSNYDILYAPGVLEVTPAPLLIAASNAVKTYGQLTTLGTPGFTASGLFNGDSVSTATFSSLGTLATANVGSYGIGVANAQGTGLANYSITYAPGTLVVNQAPLVIAAASASKTYGTFLGFNGTDFSTTGLANSDTVDSVVVSSSGSGATANAGNHSVLATAASGTGLGNYSISYLPGTLLVNPKQLTYQAGSGSYTYGNSPASMSASLSGLMPWDQGVVQGTVGAQASGGSAFAPVAKTDAGTYATLVTGLSSQGNPAAAGNYSLASSGNTNGTLTIAQRNLNYTLANTTGTYGTTTYFPAATLSGFASGDNGIAALTVTGLQGAISVNPYGPFDSTVVAANTPAGQYSVGVSGFLSGNFNPNNYALTGTPASLTIAPKLLTYAFPLGYAGASIYGTQAFTATPALSGVMPGDTPFVTPIVGVSLGGITQTLASRTPAATGYTLVVAGLGGAAGGNYAIQPVGSQTGQWNILRAPLIGTLGKRHLHLRLAARAGHGRPGRRFLRRYGIAIRRSCRGGRRQHCRLTLVGCGHLQRGHHGADGCLERATTTWRA